MILLRDVLVLLPSLAKALEPASSQLLAAIRQTAGHPVFAKMQQHVEAVIDEVSKAPPSSAAALPCKPQMILQELGWTMKCVNAIQSLMCRTHVLPSPPSLTVRSSASPSKAPSTTSWTSPAPPSAD